MVYCDNKLHHHEMFKDRKERREKVKELRENGWLIKSWTFTSPRGEKRYGLDAEKDKN